MTRMAVRALAAAADECGYWWVGEARARPTNEAEWARLARRRQKLADRLERFLAYVERKVEQA